MKLLRWLLWFAVVTAIVSAYGHTDPVLRELHFVFALVALVYLRLTDGKGAQ